VTRPAIDHVVLEVRDPLASAAFYRDVLGLRPVRAREFAAGRAPFLSSRIGAGTVIDFFPPRMWSGPAAQNPNHFCLALDRRGVADVERALRRRRVAVLRRDPHNFGARGYGRSLYFRDPDGVSIEVRFYPKRRLTRPPAAR
jgi:catechol 2,3-dioxygenase-like lactoylglutathione lyase family enzyme